MDERLWTTILGIADSRSSIIERFIETFVAVNIPDGELTPDVLRQLAIYEQQAPDGTKRIWVDWKDQPEYIFTPSTKDFGAHRFVRLVADNEEKAPPSDDA